LTELSVPKTYYFGDRWDAPAFDDAIHEATPVDGECGLCGEIIERDDSGTWQVFVLTEKQAERLPVHIECWLRQGLGSPAHLRGECSCSGQPEPADDRSWRDQGREVMRMVRDREPTVYGRLRG
jgi:hypothetical protein